MEQGKGARKRERERARRFAEQMLHDEAAAFAGWNATNKELVEARRALAERDHDLRYTRAELERWRDERSTCERWVHERDRARTLAELAVRALTSHAITGEEANGLATELRAEWLGRLPWLTEEEKGGEDR